MPRHDLLTLSSKKVHTLLSPSLIVSHDFLQFSHCRTQQKDLLWNALRTSFQFRGNGLLLPLRNLLQVVLTHPMRFSVSDSVFKCHFKWHWCGVMCWSISATSAAVRVISRKENKKIMISTRCKNKTGHRKKEVERNKFNVQKQLSETSGSLKRYRRSWLECHKLWHSSQRL